MQWFFISLLVPLAVGPIAALVCIVVLLRRRSSRWARRILLAIVGLLVLHVVVVIPGAFGYVGAHLVGTRPFERGYPGPVLDANGALVADSSDPSAAHGDGKSMPPQVVWTLPPGGARVPAVQFTASDGIALSGYYVPAKNPPATTTWVLTHGLFRNAFEIEPVAAMLHSLGAELLILDLRNHGGSDRAPASFGLRESRDVVAAVDWLRTTHGRTRVCVFGVSLGGVATAIATRDIKGLAAVVLDAPMTDLRVVGERMFEHGLRRLPVSIPSFLRPLIMHSIELWAGFDFDDVRPEDALRALPPEVPVLLIGAGDDYRAPPEAVRALFDALPTRPERKELWIRDGSDHGKVWIDDPVGYRERLARICERAVRGT